MITDHYVVSGVNNIISSVLNCSLDVISPEKNICYDLLADSLLLLELIFAIENEFDIKFGEENISQTECVSDLYRIVNQLKS